MRASGRHHQNLGAGHDIALHDPHQRDHTEIIVEPGIDDQRLQLVGIARLRRRNAFDDRFEHIDDVQTGLGADRDRVGGVDTDDRLDFGFRAIDIGGRQIDLVEHRHDFQALLHCGVAIGDRLRFHALGRVDDQQRALARGERAADFVAEVHVAGGIDEIELVDLPVFRLVRQRNGLGFDGNAALALDRIRVEHLRLHLTRLQTAAQLNDAVGERGLAVIDVGDDGEVADVPHGIGHKRSAAVAVVGLSRENSELSHSTGTSTRSDRDAGANPTHAIGAPPAPIA